MIRKKLGYLLAGIMMLGLLQACGGGGGGGSDSPAPVITDINVSAGNTTATDAAGQNYTFIFAPGSYTYTISNFAAGDVLDLPAGQAPTVFNNSWTDNSVTVRWALNGQNIDVVLTGLTNDASLNSVADFNTAFGAGTIQ